MFYPNAAFQQQPMQMGGVPVAPMGVQQPLGMNRMAAAPSAAINGVNYNISQLMNPVDVNGAQQQQQPQTKSINIDAFAGMS